MSEPPEALAGEILDGIEAELEHARRPLRVEIREIRAIDGRVFRLRVDAPRPLDESLEGARAWWPRSGARGGNAEVLSLLPEQEQLDLWQASAPLPAVGEAVFLYPSLYLEALQRAWRDPAWSRAAVERSRLAPRPHPLGLEATGFPALRAAQLGAFALLDWRDSFLHGPPGTGKTTTVGALAASLLARRPSARILLLSTTNVAVDEALRSVDRGLVHLNALTERARCKRIGLRFEGALARELPHLLPPMNRALLQRRAELERTRPPRDDASAYAAWRQAMDEVQRGLKQHLIQVAREARLLAMTTTHAAFVLDALRELPLFDLLIVDEASQVSQAHALGLAPLAERTLYAGDPRQLSPVVQNPHLLARRWLQASMFRWAEEGPRSVFLDEQSRMAPPICELISQVFYAGRLRVADDALRSPEWHRLRRLPAEPAPLAEAFRVELIEPAAGQGPERGAGGSVARIASARRIVGWLKRLAEHGLDLERDVLVLTPFRAQRALLQRMLQERDLGAVQVSTVHRAQGRERHTILYDPVDGTSEFLQGEEARRLLNVALSRAQARLIVVLSALDQERNELLGQIATVAAHGPARAPRARPLRELLALPGFPGAFHGAIVEHRGRRLKLDAHASTAQRLACLDLDSGQPRRYDLATLRGS